MAFRPTPGLILIPDISGYTEFLNEVELVHGSHIVTELLEALLAATFLDLRLSEVEGDALFFHRNGPAPPLERLEAQAREWVGAFHRRLGLMRRDTFCHCGACNTMGHLTLKVVGHYGEIGRHRIGRLTKLIGKDVVLGHRLLKNTVRLREYFFFSEALWRAAGAPELGEADVHRCRERYPVFGDVPMIARDLSAVRASVPPPPPRDAVPALPARLEGEIAARAEWQSALAVLADPDRQVEWVEGMRGIDFDRTAPPHAGQHHVCAIGAMTLRQQVQAAERNSDRFRIAYSIRPPRLMLRALYSTLEAVREGPIVRVRVRFDYRPAPWLGWLFRLVGVREMRRRMTRSLENLKALLEREAHGVGPGGGTGDADARERAAAGG